MWPTHPNNNQQSPGSFIHFSNGTPSIQDTPTTIQMSTGKYNNLQETPAVSNPGTGVKVPIPQKYQRAVFNCNLPISQQPVAVPNNLQRAPVYGIYGARGLNANSLMHDKLYDMEATCNVPGSRRSVHTAPTPISINNHSQITNTSNHSNHGNRNCVPTIGMAQSVQSVQSLQTAQHPQHPATAIHSVMSNTLHSNSIRGSPSTLVSSPSHSLHDTNSNISNIQQADDPLVPFSDLASMAPTFNVNNQMNPMSASMSVCGDNVLNVSHVTWPVTPVTDASNATHSSVQGTVQGTVQGLANPIPLSFANPIPNVVPNDPHSIPIPPTINTTINTPSINTLSISTPTVNNSAAVNDSAPFPANHMPMQFALPTTSPNTLNNNVVLGNLGSVAQNEQSISNMQSAADILKNLDDSTLKALSALTAMDIGCIRNIIRCTLPIGGSISNGIGITSSSNAGNDGSDGSGSNRSTESKEDDKSSVASYEKFDLKDLNEDDLKSLPIFGSLPNPELERLERPFQCPRCPKAFRNRAGLSNHRLIHNGLKPHKCQFKGCDKAFARSCDLTRHTRLHTGDKPFKCKFGDCEKAFTRSVQLRLHMMDHTGHRPFHCSVCGKGFKTLQNSQIHMRIHTGERPYECCHCKKRFTQSSSMRTHMASMH